MLPFTEALSLQLNDEYNVSWSVAEIATLAEEGMRSVMLTHAVPTISLGLIPVVDSVLKIPEGVSVLTVTEIVDKHGLGKRKVFQGTAVREMCGVLFAELEGKSVRITPALDFNKEYFARAVGVDVNNPPAALRQLISHMVIFRALSEDAEGNADSSTRATNALTAYLRELAFFPKVVVHRSIR